MYGRALPETAAGELGSAPMSALSGWTERRGGVEGEKKEKKKKENRNKTTTKCFTNPAVNEKRLAAALLLCSVDSTGG